MTKVTPTSSRKTDHIRINLEEDVGSGLTNGLERYHFIHQALPEINLDEIDLTLSLFGKSLNAPILISSMTGGTEEAGLINRRLATAAQQMGIAMGLGSQRAAIEQPERVATFKVRSVAPDILLFANLGAAQLNYGYGSEQCLRAVEMIEANGLILHLNALQEAVQPEGDINWAGLLKKIEKVCRTLTVPVIAKEVGWGISGDTARKLVDAGVSAIDVAGAGGTSWSQVEMYRLTEPRQARIAGVFRNWGIPTADSILQVREACPNLPIFASGGLRSGLDIAKTIALGAVLGGMAGPFLQAAAKSAEATAQVIEDVRREIQITLFAAGAADLQALPGKLIRKDQ
jgi:isopentenyl-diphosphate delta-isomerase